ncbi:putative Uncharacterized exonuclease [Glarea lozoyensis 74030]|nr:putative Uncharacterized exonuclease [Glarea lozoyensis 74030]
MLTAPLPKDKEDRNRDNSRKGARPAKTPPGWKNSRTRVTEFVHSPEELLENEYVVHPASYSTHSEKQSWEVYRNAHNTSTKHGWIDTEVQHWDDGDAPEKDIEAGSLTAGRELLAMDCEMCMTGDKEFSLTRISIVGWDGSVILDELVKPEKPIVNYLTQYSGITEKMLANVTTTLEDIQKKLSKILHPRTILIGHSLNSDLNALKITHPYILDTAILYPHPRGPPLKSSLKWLAQKYLNRAIQKGHGTTGPGAGHDSIEDARTCLDLVKQKCEKGPQWGSNDLQGENIFKRVARTGVRYKNQGGAAIPSNVGGKSTAAIDWGDPKKGPGSSASFQIGCKGDDDVAEGVLRAVKGDPDGKEIPGGGVDFVWARLRELEAIKGWWNENKLVTNDAARTTVTTANTAVGEKPPATQNQPESDGTTPPKSSKSVSDAITDLVKRIQKIYDGLPPCTAFIVYSGSGDPREMSRLSNMHAQFKREYRTKKWDELSVKWTDTEEQAMKRAAKEAREGGVGFMVIK